jgi:hypothetical protein
MAKTIVLCGGLANSPYIKERVDKFCREKLEGKAKLIVPRETWSAIAQGAALRALKPRSTIDSRKCRRSYGVCTHRKFIEGQDPEVFAFHCPVTGKRLDGVMKWHIRKVRSSESCSMLLRGKLNLTCPDLDNGIGRDDGDTKEKLDRRVCCSQ